MLDRDVCIVDYDVITAYGHGAAALMRGIASGVSSAKEVTRFSTAQHAAHIACCVDGLSYHEGESLVMQMFSRLVERHAIPEEAMLLFASTVGEVDLLEQSISGTDTPPRALIDTALRLRELLGIRGKTFAISSACASTLAACARARTMIASGEAELIVVAAADAVTEFVYAGFSSLLALDVNGARPFDATRSGLTVGEAAGYLLLTSREYAASHGLTPKAILRGCGLSNDANHMTGPSRDGAGLATAIENAMKQASCATDGIAMIAAHGTGTTFNDAMELKAFKRIFQQPIPIYSVKGALGHTMGSAGLIQVITACEAMHARVTPLTVGMQTPDPDAVAWAHTAAMPWETGRDAALIVNAGFGGVNAAVVLGGAYA